MCATLKLDQRGYEVTATERLQVIEVPRSRPEYDPALDSLFDVPKAHQHVDFFSQPVTEYKAHRSPTARKRSPDEKALQYMTAYGGSALNLAKLLGMKLDTKTEEELYSSMMNTDYSALEAHVHTQLNTNPNTTAPLEKPMQNLTVTRPVLVGNVNILTAQDFELAAIVREAQEQIENNADVAKLSEHYKAKQEELHVVIALCVEQLDKDKENQAK